MWRDRSSTAASVGIAGFLAAEARGPIRDRGSWVLSSSSSSSLGVQSQGASSNWRELELVGEAPLSLGPGACLPELPAVYVPRQQPWLGVPGGGWCGALGSKGTDLGSVRVSGGTRCTRIAHSNNFGSGSTAVGTNKVPHHHHHQHQHLEPYAPLSRPTTARQHDRRQMIAQRPPTTPDPRCRRRPCLREPMPAPTGRTRPRAPACRPQTRQVADHKNEQPPIPGPSPGLSATLGDRARHRGYRRTPASTRRARHPPPTSGPPRATRVPPVGWWTSGAPKRSR